MNMAGNQGYMAPPIMVNELGDKGVERIGDYAVEAYKAKHCPPIEWECNLVADQNKEKTYVIFTHDEEGSAPIEFFNGIIEGVTRIMYNPQLDFENLHAVVVRIEKNKDPQFVMIPDSIWGKKQMLQKFRDIGGRFALRKSDAAILKILADYLSIFLNGAVLTVDPRAGWVKGKAWDYRVNGSWGVDELPTVFQRKTLRTASHDIKDMLRAIQRPLSGDKKELYLLLMSILFCGLSFSRIMELSGMAQEKFIVIICSSTKVQRFLKNFFSFYKEDAAENWSLSMPNKQLKRILMESKDQVLVFNVDTEDVSGRRGANIGLLEHYVKFGSLPEGQKAEAITVFLTRGFPYDISLDDALVLDIAENDISWLLNDEKDIRMESCKIVEGFIEIIKKKEIWFEQHFSEKSNLSNLSDLLKICAEMMMELKVINSQIPDKCKMWTRVNSLLDAAENFAETDGAGGVACSVILQRILEGKIRLKETRDKIDAEELCHTILYDKEALYITDEALTKFILPEFTSLPVSPIILRKILLNEEFLHTYCSKSGRKGNQRRRPIHSKDNVVYAPWMTALKRERFEAFTEISIEELREETE